MANASAERPGILYVVGTPIGNLEDLTSRAVATLRACQVIAAEDTRRTRALLTRHGLGGRIVSYHKFNESRRVGSLLDVLADGGSVALVTDAGTPALTEPGAELVNRARNAGHRIVPIPGPSAVTALISASGFPAGPFTFIGFLPQRKAERRRALEELRLEPRPMIFFESPHRIAGMLDDAIAVLGDRSAFLGREMTKVYEEFLHGSLGSIRSALADRPIRGEFSLLVSGSDRRGPARSGERAEGQAISPGSEVLRLVEAGWNRKEALRRVCRERGLSRKEVYNDLVRATGLRTGRPGRIG